MRPSLTHFGKTEKPTLIGRFFCLDNLPYLYPVLYPDLIFPDYFYSWGFLFNFTL